MESSEKPKISVWTATALVVANMIGTGAFTSLGFQLQAVQSTGAIITLWVAGAMLALCGAFSYAELGSRIGQAGGEYRFLSVIYSPFIGYLAGWISLTVGFAAPVALAAMALQAYVNTIIPINGSWLAVLVVIAVAGWHSVSLYQSSRFQNVTTLLKLIVIWGFIGVGVLASPQLSPTMLSASASWLTDLQKPAFYTSLIYVTYAYSGWNAAVYIIPEIANVRRNLPRALVGGTLLVGLLYVGLQLIFMRQASIEQLQGQVEIGQIVARTMLGEQGGQLTAGLIALILISSLSAMTWVGGRVVQAISDEHPLWHWLGGQNQRGIPVRAIWGQALLSVIMILTGTFSQLLVYSGLLMQLSSALAVAGLIRLRSQPTNSTSFKSPLFPIPQLVYLLITLLIIVYLAYTQPLESLIGLGILGVGSLTYWISQQIGGRRSFTPNA